MAEPIAEWATSPDRAVTVLAAPGGLPIEVQISPNALRQPPEVLARLVLDTAAQAGQRATRRLHRHLAATVGPEAARTMDRVGLSVTAAPDGYDDNEPDTGFDGLLRGAR
jgi:hypothetical protein